MLTNEWFFSKTIIPQRHRISVDCTSCYNENILCVCYVDWNRHWVIYFLKIKLAILLQVMVLQLDQVVTFHNHNQVQAMVLMVWIQYQSNLLNQEMIGHVCIKVGIAHHLADMGWNAKYSKPILETLNDNIYRNEKHKNGMFNMYLFNIYSFTYKHECQYYIICHATTVNDIVAESIQETIRS